MTQLNNTSEPFLSAYLINLISRWTVRRQTTPTSSTITRGCETPTDYFVLAGSTWTSPFPAESTTFVDSPSSTHSCRRPVHRGIAYLHRLPVLVASPTWNRLLAIGKRERYVVWASYLWLRWSLHLSSVWGSQRSGWTLPSSAVPRLANDNCWYTHSQSSVDRFLESALTHDKNRWSLLV